MGEIHTHPSGNSETKATRRYQEAAKEGVVSLPYAVVDEGAVVVRVNAIVAISAMGSSRRLDDFASGAPPVAMASCSCVSTPKGSKVSGFSATEAPVAKLTSSSKPSTTRCRER
eukprot:CAMPEP_0180505972 /NCGR_PEP_ID=MMETSP1036_2-20121128/47682_1 /TAXON_ID=632150 /ORGANISM="Azadinium spinosum, Strain 3D9" /LENGTH=113 /DNA_ID=CAMNT_0022515765 /DNA_START=245 /DNA_END=583 /DNA_ORIENTATION=+